MHPVTILTLFLVLVALIFVLMEISARNAVRKFEKSIKHSQGE
jgi:hypothetical protein|nr:MAG TPA: Glycine rich protein family [Caudoviricetes sp.]